MQIKTLIKKIEKYNIPLDAEIETDSGWECSATEVTDIYYNKNENIVVLTRDDYTVKDYYRDEEWMKMED